ncbi:copper amine oxidase N-terminal domain-containing protein [Cohnella fermenti]|nr:copper amine oxidase N-terminal domain-containing protein [Cohnella fermenti]
MKQPKWVLALIIAAGALAASAEASADSDPIRLSVNGTLVESGTTPIAVKGSVLVPLRTAAEALGASIEWQSGSRTVVLSKWATRAALTAGSDEAKIVRWTTLSEAVKLGTTPKLIDGRMYVPIRFLSDTFGYVVYYSSGTVYIRDPISPAQQETLASGSLVEARKLVLTASRISRSDVEPLDGRATGESFGTYRLFPEDEALRYLVLSEDCITYWEYQDGFMVATWTARVGEAEVGIRNFLNGSWTEERGSKPDLEAQSYYYYLQEYSMDTYTEASGRLSSDGTMTSAAYNLDVGGSPVYQAEMLYANSGEVRAEKIGVGR